MARTAEIPKELISLDLATKLATNGCTLHSEYRWVRSAEESGFSICYMGSEKNHSLHSYPAYEILWEICVKYPKEFFGDKYLGDTNIQYKIYPNFAWSWYAEMILNHLRTGKTKDEIEKYIWELCLFNPENKND